MLVLTGLSDGEGDWRGEVLGMLRADAERSQDRLRRSDPRSSLSEAEAATHEEMYATVSSADGRTDASLCRIYDCLRLRS